MTDVTPEKKSLWRRWLDSAPKAMFEDVSLYGDRVQYKGERVALPARASVETVGDIRRRVTATRLVTTGVFAFALKKKKDDRELYLTVSGVDGEFVVEVDPKKGAAARQFAAIVNSAKPKV